MPVVFHLAGRSVLIHVETSWSILFLKQLVCMKLKCDPHVFVLSHQGAQLNDWEKVSHYEFPLDNGTSIDVLPLTNINRFYVLCYPCNDVTPAVFALNCDKCHSSKFTVSHDIANPQIKTAYGTCRECQNSSAKVSITCSKDASHNPSIFLNQVFRNLDKLVCIACCSEDGEVVVKFCDKCHILCLDCFRHYAESYLSDARFVMIPDVGLTLSCPVGCENSHITDTHLFRILGKEFYSRYKELAARLFCYTEGFFSCPNCGIFWERPNSHSQWLICERPYGCGAEFCSQCRNLISNNVGCTCNQSASADQLSISDRITRLGIFGSWSGVKISADDLATSSLIAVSCKICPRCNSQTEKDGGCNHMTCSICGFEWCWICHNEWSTFCQSNHWF
ncbi:hypothetical protein Aperf_G00000127892 [Anoplocephala perfoliata]